MARSPLGPPYPGSWLGRPSVSGVSLCRSSLVARGFVGVPTRGGLAEEVAVKNWWLRLLVIGQLLWALGPLTAAHASAAGAAASGTPTYTVTVSSAFLQAEPNWSAGRTYSVFRGQTYTITGRTADRSWVSLDVAGAAAGTWIYAAFGTISGYLQGAPVVDAPPAALPQSGPQIVPSQPFTATVAEPAPTGASAVTGIPGKTLNLTITTASLFALDAPDWSANRVASLFRGQQYVAVQRDPNAEWLQIILYGTAQGTLRVWVPAGAGLLDGNVLDLPQPGVHTPPPPPPPEPAYGVAPSAPPPSWIPKITPHMAAVYAQSVQHGRDRRMFTVAGDCNSLSYDYLLLVAKNLIDLHGNDYLRNTIQEFNSAFVRDSLTVAGGFNTASVMDPSWASPADCQDGESPFACELRVTRASIVFIALGTGDQFDWRSFDSNYRKLIEYSLNNGVLPVLVTKADALESEEAGAPGDYINNDIRALAKEYDVPLMDFAAATAGLPQHGLRSEPGSGFRFHLSDAGMGMHVLTTLQTLDAIWRSLG
jgi:hypothetical protein